MVHVFVERDFDSPLTQQDVEVMGKTGADCMGIYNINWHQSFLADDGHKLLCHFEAPDTEAIRMVLRQSGSDAKAVWSGTVHDAPVDDSINVVVERLFDQPVTVGELQTIEDAGAWCLEMHRVTFIRTFFSCDNKRMICLYKAPDAESVRLAQRQAKMPVDKVWACSEVSPPSP